MDKLILGEGPIPSKGMIVGEAPGKTEEKEGRPFVGQAGSLLEQALAEADAERDDFYITNVYKLRPQNEKGASRPPTQVEVEKHLPLLKTELLEVYPDVILLLGNTAAQTMLGDNFREHRHNWYRDSAASYLFTWHPAAVIYDESKQGAFFADIEAFVREVRE